jgi:hypothetical protein
MTSVKTLTATVLGLSAVALVLGGCGGKTLVFGTATKFGLDVSQRADQTVEVTMGYDRYEIASIPTEMHDAEQTSKKDTYSVLGIFSVSYGNPWTGEPLVLRQFFATGWAARGAALKPAFQQFFGHKTGEIINQGDQEIQRQRSTGAQ